jgi:hypothetical protein
MIARIDESWSSEWNSLEGEEQALLAAGASERDPIMKAISIAKRRLRDGYLLGELAQRSFLPAYGFPTNVIPFDNLTVDRYKRDVQEREERDDNRFVRRELPSRDAITALREYAPGSQVVIDGLVYRSAGVTLNWKIPAEQEAVKELQSIKTAWRCNNCGASGSSRFLTDAHCEYCGYAGKKWKRYLEPAGFAVDFYTNPTNDVSSQHFIPVEEPWISISGDWLPLSNPELGKFRFTSQGHIFNHSAGEYGNGYVLCLECGRAEPAVSPLELPSAFQRPHKKLRRTKNEDVLCPGSNDSWKLTRVVLGTENYTDVFELQLKDELGNWLADKVVAQTLAVAFRDSIAQLIGIRADELGCGWKESKAPSGSKVLSILIYDRFAAGYSSRAEDFISRLFEEAAGRLKCPAACDSACPRCILDFDQRFLSDHLDRKRALNFLTKNWLARFRLPANLQFFGPKSELEPRSISESIWRTVVGGSVSTVRLYAGGSLSSWDVGMSPLRDLAFRLAGKNLKVQVIVPKSVQKGLAPLNLYPLASLAEHPEVEVIAVTDIPKAGGGFLVAETSAGKRKNITRWAVRDLSAIELGPDWGSSNESLVKVKAHDWLSLPGEVLSMTQLLPPPQKGDRRVDITNELDGSLKGFGNRFWNFILSPESLAADLLLGGSEEIVQVSYSDRYLSNPISVALLFQVLSGLKKLVGQSWVVSSATVTTLANKNNSGDTYRNQLGHDWLDIQHRTQVIKFTLEALVPKAEIIVREHPWQIEHGRPLRLELSSKRTIEVRFDQGMGHWRIPHSTPLSNKWFDFGLSPREQFDRIKFLHNNVEGQQTSTQIFLSVREK